MSETKIFRKKDLDLEPVNGIKTIGLVNVSFSDELGAGIGVFEDCSIPWHITYDEVINILFYIAEADNNVSDSEITMIRSIAKIFGLSENQFEGIKESRKSSDKLNPYIVLGCSSNDDFATVRKKYLQLSKEHHPDILMNKGVPKEVIEESKKKMRAINSAFDQIEKMKQK